MLMLLAVLALSGIFVDAQISVEKTEIKKIDEYTKTLDTFVKKNKSPHLIFADISQDEKQKWQKFESAEALEKFREDTETYTIAYNWRKNEKIVVANFTLFSRSGDWAKYVYLHFRENGTLVKVESQLNTFYGNFSFLQSIYFDEKGNILKNTSEYLDLQTQKPTKVSNDYILDNGDRIKPFYFKNTNQLPYSHLLKD